MSNAIETPAPFMVTREFLEDLEAHPEKIDDPAIVTPEIYEAAKPFILRELEWPAATVVAETSDEAATREANEAAARGTKSAAVAETEDDAAPRLSALQTAYEKRKTAVAAADLVLNEADIDYLEDEDGYRAQQARKSAAQRARNTAIDEYQDVQHTASVEPLARRATESVDARFYREADSLSAHFPAIKSTKGMRVAEKEAIPYFTEIYKTFNGGTLDGLTTEIRDQAWTKYLKDPEFRKTLPTAPADFNNVAIVLEAKEMVKRVGGTLRGAVAELMIERGEFKTMLESARQEGSRASGKKVSEALQRQQSEVVAAPVGGGGDQQPKPMAVPFDKATAEKYVTNYLDKIEASHPLTDFEKIHLNTAKSLMGLVPIDI